MILSRVSKAFLVAAVIALLFPLIPRGTGAFVRVTPLPVPSTAGPDAVAAACAAEPFPTHDVTYVCDCGEGADPSCRPGNDGASGVDPAHPLRTLGAAGRRFSSLPAGGTVAFCRGGVFRAAEAISLVSYDCRAEAPCTLREYLPPNASASAALPRFVFASGGLSFADGGDANHDEGYRVRNLVLEGSGSERGVFVYNDVSDLDLCNLTIRGFDLGVHVAGGNAPDARGEAGPPSADGKNRRVRLRGSYLESNSNQGWLGGCDGCVVESNVFRGNGRAATVLNHSIYFDQRGTDERIVGNVILENVHDAARHCQGVAIVVHGDHRGMAIEDNAISEPVDTAAESCWGIAIDPGDEAPDRFERVVVRGNRIDDVGNVGIGLASCIDCTVEANVIRQGNPFESAGIVAPDKSHSREDAGLQRVSIRGNHVVFRGDAAGTGIRVGDEGRAHVVRGNAIDHEGRGTLTCIDVPVAARSCVADENRCFGPNVDRFAWSAREPSLDRVKRRGQDRSSRVAPPP